MACPLGIGRQEFWSALMSGRSGIGRATLIDADGTPTPLIGEVRNFDPKRYVANRKSLKVMARDAQLGMAAASLACQDAAIVPGKVDPQRFGVVLGADPIQSPIRETEASFGSCTVDGRFDFSLWGTKALAACFPLSFLSVLPNMIASHVSIAHDARGPNNTIHHAEISSLLAVSEAASVIRRGAADVMLAGGASSQMHPMDFVRRWVTGGMSPRRDGPETVVRPFDAGRDGQVWSEGAAVLVLEDRRHAEARGARILARVLGAAATCEPVRGYGQPHGDGLCRAMRQAMARSGVAPHDLGHVNAHGLSTPAADRIEAQALRRTAPDVPVTALKSYFGNLGAAGAALELAASVLSLGEGRVPATRNYDTPDPDCPIPVIHGDAMPSSAAAAMSVTWMASGPSAAVVLGRAD